MMGSTVPEIIVKPPGRCKREERAAFLDVAAKGDEVDRADIQAGIERAALLLWIAGDKGPLAVGALKNPVDQYRRAVFRKAGAPAEAKEYLVEFGYLYVEEAYRSNGYGPAIVGRALREYGHGIFATVRADNRRMKEILTENGFNSVGDQFPSVRSPQRMLQLFALP